MLDNIEALEQRRNQILATAAAMTIRQTYMAAVANLKLEPNTDDMARMIAVIKAAAAEPIHGLRDSLTLHTRNEVAIHFTSYSRMEDGCLHLETNGNSFDLIYQMLAEDFNDNLRIAEQTA